MVDVLKSSTFDRWLRGLNDRHTDGNPGDVKPVGGGISSQSRDIAQAQRIAAEWRSDE